MSEFYQIINSYADKLIVFFINLINLSYSFYGFKWVDNINQIISLIMAPAMAMDNCWKSWIIIRDGGALSIVV